MTTWVEPEGGRERGLVGARQVVHAGAREPADVLRGGRFAGRPGPGLVFGMAVVLVEEATRMAVNPGAALQFPTARWLAAALTVALAVLLVAPAAIHALSALETLALVVLACPTAAG